MTKPNPTRNRPLRALTFDPYETAGRFFLPDVLFSLLIAGTLFVNIGPANTSPVDALLAAIALMYLPLLALSGLRNHRFSELCQWFGLPVLGYLTLGGILLILVGGNPLAPIKDLASFAYLIVGAALLLVVKKRPSLWLPQLTLVLSTYGLLALTVRDTDSRGSGSFDDPNTAGFWFAGAFVLLLLIRYPRRIWLRLPALGAALYGTLLTASMGALSALLIGSAAVLLMQRGVRLWVLALLLPVAAVIFQLIPRLMTLTPFYAATGDTRFGATFEFRSYLWGRAFDQWLAHPMGMGPDGFSISRTVVLAVNGSETHNDYLGILVDYGFLGLVLWLLALYGLFRASGQAAAYAVFIASASLAHSLLNFRQLWVFMALAIAVQYWRYDYPPLESSDQRKERTRRSAREAVDATFRRPSSPTGLPSADTETDSPTRQPSAVTLG